MPWLKQNWVLVGLGVLFLTVLFFIRAEGSNNSPEAALIGGVASLSSSSSVISEKEVRVAKLKESLPRFEDYPAKVYPIPPKPLLDHHSNPYGMLFWTGTENWTSQSETYNMGGHYLLDRYATGNPDVLIIDGLTGQVFNEYGGMDFVARADSSLVIFDPFQSDCFSPSGDYDQCYDTNGGNPRYAYWNGEQFFTICEPVVKNWEVVSCGEQEFNTPIPVIWNAKILGCLVSCAGYSFQNLDPGAEHTYFQGYDGLLDEHNLDLTGRTFQVKGQWTGIDCAYRNTVFAGKCTPSVDIASMEEFPVNSVDWFSQKKVKIGDVNYIFTQRQTAGNASMNVSFALWNLLTGSKSYDFWADYNFRKDEFYTGPCNGPKYLDNSASPEIKNFIRSEVTKFWEKEGWPRECLGI